MVANDNIVSFGSPHETTSQILSGVNPQIVKECRLIITSTLPKCFIFFDSLDDTLFKLADNADSTKQEEYFLAMRHLRVVQANIKKNFTQLIVDDFDKFWATTPTKQPHLRLEAITASESNLTLLQNDELEEDIAIKRISSKGEAIFGSELSNLNDRFAHMMNSTSDVIINNPLAPDSMVKRLKQVITPLPISISIKLVIYKQFEKEAVAELGGLYHRLNDQLIKNDILPKLSYKLRKSAHQSQQSGLQSEISDNGPQSIPAIFNELRQLINRSGGQEQNLSDYATDGSANVADIPSVLSALSNLQHSSGESSYSENGALKTPEVRTTLLQTLNQNGASSHTISKLDEDTMDIIAMLFEFILEDRNIPDPMRALLARLQIPMLKVAIADKTFFSTKNHSARRLLNDLAKLATGWSSIHGHQDKLYQQIESIVETILTKFDTNVEIFDELNKQLHQFIERQEHNLKAAEQRTAKASEGKDKLILAQQDVDKLIKQTLSEQSPVPPVVISIIEEGWKQVLTLRRLQKGLDSPEWQEAVTLMNQLIWSVKPKSDPNERKHLLESIPKMLKPLRDGLSGAAFNQHKMSELFKSLQECHVKCLSGNPIRTIDVHIEERPINTSVSTSANIADNINITPTVPVEKKVISDEKAIKLASNLKIGTWLELRDDEEVRRIKFSWRSNLTGRCLFVTYQGLRAAEISLQELTNWFQQGQVVIIDQSTPLMDRALVSMMNTINKHDHSDRIML